MPAAITVGAVADNDARASFSNFGPCLDLFAPGVTILGASHLSDTATQTVSGTSPAALVAGAAAQFLSCNPLATPQQVRDALVDAGSKECVTGAGAGSPNVLLHNNVNAPPFSCGGTPPPTSAPVPAPVDTTP